LLHHQKKGRTTLRIFNNPTHQLKVVKQKKTITGKQKKTSNLSTIPISNFQLTICEDVTFLDQKTKANNCCGLPTLLLDFWLQRL